MVAAQKKVQDDASYVDELTPGTELLNGQFTIDKFLNSGGFGITYLAKDGLDRRVVIKECFPSSFCHRSRAIVMPRSKTYTKELKSVVELFVQEARSLAKLSHPNIVGVHQVFEDNATAYMVLDFVEGRDLLDTLEDPDHGLTPPQIKGILKDVLSAVGYIHSQDVLHRDISPDNILLDGDLRPVLIDFGAAREEATKKSRVLSALRVVKDGYSPQEFYIQGSDQNPSSDLYALGASFYHLITGEIPPNSQARLAAIATGDKDTYVPLVNRVNGYDKRFLSALDKALAILPKDRLQSAEAWLDAMEGNRKPSRIMTTPISSAAAATIAVEKQQKRLKTAPLFGSVAVIAVIAALGWGTGLMDRSDAPSENAVATAPVALGETTLANNGTPAASTDLQAEATQLAEDAAREAEEAVRLAIADAEVALVVEAAPVETTDATLADALKAAEDAAAALVTEAVPVENTDATLADALKAAEDAAAALVAEAVPVESTDATLADALKAAEDAAAALVAEVDPVENTDATLADALKAAEDAAAALVAEVDPVENTDTALADVVNPVEDAVTALVVEADPVVDADTALAEVANPVEDAAPALVVEADPVVDADTALAEAVNPIEDRVAALFPDAKPAEDTVTPLIPDATPVEDTALTYLLSDWSLELPFTSLDASNVIGQSTEAAPLWAREGTQILAVNGTAVDQISDISNILRGQISPEENTMQSVTFTLQEAGSAQEVEKELQLPVVQDTILLNGMSFVTRYNGEGWATFVSDLPNETSEFKVGDQLVAFIDTSEPLSSRTALKDILESGQANGLDQYSFAVSRDGSMWLLTMKYTGGA